MFFRKLFSPQFPVFCQYFICLGSHEKKYEVNVIIKTVPSRENIFYETYLSTSTIYKRIQYSYISTFTITSRLFQLVIVIKFFLIVKILKILAQFFHISQQAKCEYI